MFRRAASTMIGTILIGVMLASWILTPSGVQAAETKQMLWYKTTKKSEANDLHDVVMNKQGVYVAVGKEGTILRSTNAHNWSSVDSNTYNHLIAVATNGSRFVTIGENGIVLSSLDGVKWNKATISLPYTLSQAVLGEDKSYYNQNWDINWKEKLKQSDLHFESILWDGKRFIISGKWEIQTGKKKKGSNLFGDSAYLSDSFIMTTSDGANWKLQLHAASGERIVYTGKQYVILHTSGVSISKDLVNWQHVRINTKPKQVSFTDLVYNNGTYTAIGWDGAMSARFGAIFVSSDAVHWKEVKNKTTLGTNPQVDVDMRNGFADLIMNSILWDGKQYWIAGYKGMLLRSVDGKEWEMWSNNWNTTFVAFKWYNSTGAMANMNKIYYDGSQYIEVGNRGTILLSKDLKQVSVVRQRTSPDYEYLATDGVSRYLAAGDNGTLFESKDGYGWNPAQLPVTEYELDSDKRFKWYGVAANRGTAIAVGAETVPGYLVKTLPAEYFYSNAYGEWEKKAFPMELDHVHHVAYMNNRFYIFADQGYLTSVDGLNWSKLNTAKPVMKRMVSNGKVMIGIAANDYKTINENDLYISTDGQKWNRMAVTVNKKRNRVNAQDVLWDGKQFIIPNARYIPESSDFWYEAPIAKLTSANGQSWTVNSITTAYWGHVSNGNGYVAIGKSGLLSSSNGIDYRTAFKASNNEIDVVIWDGHKYIAAGQNGTILVSEKKQGATEPDWVDGIVEYVVHKVNEKLEQEEQIKQAAELRNKETLAFQSEASTRVNAVIDVSEKYNYLYGEQKSSEDWTCVLDAIDPITYVTTKTGEYKNQLKFRVDYVEERLYDAIKEIIEAHTGGSMAELEGILRAKVNSMLENPADFSELITLDGIELSIQYESVSNHIYIDYNHQSAN